MNTIETHRLLLRRWREEDYLDFHEFMSDKKVAECAGTKIISDLEESKLCIKNYIKYNQSFAIVLKTSNKVIGFIGMDDFTPDNFTTNIKQRYIGYTINSNYWRKGYATEATLAIIHYLSTTENIKTIWSSHYDFNEASKGVITNCGLQYRFSRHKTLKALNDKTVEELFYSIP